MADAAPKKTKRPTAQKRIIQSEKRRMRNRSFKSQVRTAIRSLEQAKSENQNDSAKEILNTVYSLFDKGVKLGIYKKNKAARAKRNYASAIAK